MLVVGLTGGIASGKSSVAQRWQERGATVIDTDLIARELTAAGGAAIPAIVDAFGAEVVDAEGALDRATMRKRVFHDPAQRKRLEAILHPLIRQRSEEELAAAQTPLAVLVVPLLVESGHYDWVDRVVVVDLPEAQQLERLQRRDGIDPTLARNILAAQTDRSTRLARADLVIDNQGSYAELMEQADAVLDKLYAWPDR